jgi:hypothetical protein
MHELLCKDLTLDEVGDRIVENFLTVFEMEKLEETEVLVG